MHLSSGLRLKSKGCAQAYGDPLPSRLSSEVIIASSSFVAHFLFHAKDLLDYSRLTKDDALGNLNLAFDVAYEHLSVPKLLDAEDVALMPRPDERSVMTYVAQLYNVFAAMDQIETAGRRIGKVRCEKIATIIFSSCLFTYIFKIRN